MITDLEDVRKAREYLTACREELTARGLCFNNEAKLGAMVEVPSAAILASEILQEVDFISIGTNDLLQYLTGADRDNPEVLHYYDPQNIAFRWLLEHILEGARKLGREKDVTICGEIAGNPKIIPLLLKMGFRSFSVPPVVAEEIRNVIAHVSTADG
jgi:phosphotransferase system enzyme I (PtsI)